MQTVQSYMTPVQNALRNPSTLMNRSAQTASSTTQTVVNNPQSFLTRVRNLDSATLTQVGIVTAEVIGFFSIGEMLGRFKIVGYRSNAPAHH